MNRVDLWNIFNPKKHNQIIIETLIVWWWHATSCHCYYLTPWVCDDVVVAQVNHLIILGDLVYKWMKNRKIIPNQMNEICDIGNNLLSINSKFKLQLKLVVNMFNFHNFKLINISTKVIDLGQVVQTHFKIIKL